MITKNRFTIGYFNQVLSGEWSVLPWRGIVNAARKNNVNLISFHGNTISDKNEFNEQGNTVYDLAKGGLLDGLITWKGSITWQMNESEVINFCKQYKVPIVTIEGALKGFPCVTYGNYEGMRLIVDHLINVHGYKKIGYMGIVENHVGYQERYRGYTDSMKAHGITIDPMLVKPWVSWISTIDNRPSNEVLDNWLKDVAKSKLEVIIGACDPISLWIMERLENLGIHVPNDIAIVGFDGFTQSKVTNPPLTTINPSWTELGTIAFDTMLGILNGKTVPEKTIVPAYLVVARTCGCMEENVNFVNNQNFKKIIPISKNKNIINAMYNVLKGTIKEDMIQMIEKFLEAFLKELKGKNKNYFLRIFDDILRKLIKEKYEIMPWQNVISILQKNVIPQIHRRKYVNKANILCNQARVLIGNTATRYQACKHMEMEERIDNERSFGMNLISTFELDKLMDLLAEGLPNLGITGCYVALYENPKTYQFPDPVSEWSRLVLAYTEKSRVKLDQDGRRFQSREIIPEDLWPKNKACNFLVNPLYFRENQIGYIVFQANLLIGNTYNFLSKEISSGLQGTLLIKKINTHSEILESGIEDLSSSIEEMVKNIEMITNSMFNQENAVEEEATSIDQLEKNISNITDISNKSKEISKKLDNIASIGVDSVKNLIKLIQDIHSKSKNILDLLSLIQQIADQTKLLAFNATIESVRAGEKGKGFYVVAKEISKLTEDINKSISGIEGILNLLMNKINESAELSEKTVEGLDKIIENSQYNTGISDQLNSGMIEQGKGINEILQITHKLVNITSEIKNSMSEQMTTTKDFKAALLKLKNITKIKD